MPPQSAAAASWDGAPPVSENGFTFVHGELFAEASGQNRHRRATVAELQAHVAAGSDKDKPAHWFEAQLVHYGLKTSKTKAVARMRLLDAVGGGNLCVPEHVLKLEAKLKKEWTKNDRELKKTPSGSKASGSVEAKKATTATAKTTAATAKKATAATAKTTTAAAKATAATAKTTTAAAKKATVKKEAEDSKKTAAAAKKATVKQEAEDLKKTAAAAKKTTAATAKKATVKQEAEDLKKATAATAKKATTAAAAKKATVKKEAEDVKKTTAATAKKATVKREAEDAAPAAAPAAKKAKTAAAAEAAAKETKAKAPKAEPSSPKVRQKQTARRGGHSQGLARGASASAAAAQPQEPPARTKQTARRSGAFMARSRIPLPYEDLDDEEDVGMPSSSNGDSSSGGSSSGGSSDGGSSDGVLAPLGLLNGSYDVTSGYVESQWSVGSNFSLDLTLEGSSLWGAFDLGIVEGVLFFKTRPWESSHNSVPFIWRGRELDGPIHYGYGNQGWMTFYGNGRVEGELDYMSITFEGDRLPGQGTRGTQSAQSLRSEWESYSEDEYDRLNRARW